MVRFQGVGKSNRFTEPAVLHGENEEISLGGELLRKAWDMYKSARETIAEDRSEFYAVPLLS